MVVPQSTPETEEEHLQAFGPDVGSIYHGLYLEVLWIHAKWLEHRKLFAQSPERIQLLNNTASFFFFVVQDVLWEDVVLHIARLTDPPEQQRNENLSLRCLARAVPDPELAADLVRLVDAAESAAGFARVWRNKHLAHRDRAVALRGGPRSLPDVSRLDVEDVLERFRDVLNRAHSAYLGGQVMFRDFIASGDADAVVVALAMAEDLERQRRERARTGTSRPEDFDLPDVPE